ncbi:hypothetical protein CR513_35295, partial [Mucuna pruriens]
MIVNDIKTLKNSLGQAKASYEIMNLFEVSRLSDLANIHVTKLKLTIRKRMIRKHHPLITFVKNLDILKPSVTTKRNKGSIRSKPLVRKNPREFVTKISNCFCFISL